MTASRVNIYQYDSWGRFQYVLWGNSICTMSGGRILYLHFLLRMWHWTEPHAMLNSTLSKLVVWSLFYLLRHDAFQFATKTSTMPTCTTFFSVLGHFEILALLYLKLHWEMFWSTYFRTFSFYERYV